MCLLLQKMSQQRKPLPEHVQFSKTLSSVLRHRADELGLKPRADGYVLVNEMLKLPQLRRFNADVDKVKKAVNDNDKQRFQLLEEGGVLLIRATQGHSIKTVESDKLLT